MRRIDGRAIAATITAEVTAAVATASVPPTLAVLVPTRDEATAWYVRSIERAARKVGIACRVVQLEEPSRQDVVDRLADLSADPSVHGVICQTPLPDGVALDDVGAFIDPRKDVDGANPESLGRVAAGLSGFAPATAVAVLEVLRHEGVPLAGTRAVVVGRSTVVGKPAALLLLAADATVTVCHSRTADLPAVTREADVLVVAVGRAGFVGAEHVKPGAVVVDVGTNPAADGSLVGDVRPDVAGVAGALTPVPGGVGPVTTAVLLKHTAQAARGL
ncbi:bifunctional 5,10-methylenetetrahydrofolate dehydrogenase/5,10-methenyltetrahydrofolate cyclohydrolase [Saccharothrix violaceirubra]|uniref:Bifunctional protein FolD n=1 Tax=Saccharothrix violaceirubra TaxID=413306 RepID=A0A7W7T6I2_9PSEU|nr:bifunctional 5,10-methylenetetrahydrofolate dehydrogenase/5,10-methenyltetrahydrofolate cyclohydrolase [Saccharothrix violaceirubra]MBB4966120.1 methylenetetrahydrofolate dehydrogenase (NADP+)/methenyltetrahydrofolate cyclohydrolase [Saccharothrix violaceirubra]